MSIVAYVGLPGSGKSYGVVENVIIPAAEKGRKIVTNLPLKVGYFKDDYPNSNIVVFDPQAPLDGDFEFDLDEHAGAIWVIDEVQHYWPSGLKTSSIDPQHKAFFTEHRHSVGEDGLTSEVVLVTQNLDQIAAFVRNLIEDTFRAKKLSIVGANKRYIVEVFSGAQKGTAGGTPTRRLTGKYKESVYRYYKSHTKNKFDFAAGLEEKADGRNNIFKSQGFWALAVLSVFLIFFGISSITSYFTRFSEDEPELDNVPATQNYKAPTKKRAAPTQKEKYRSALAAFYQDQHERHMLQDIKEFQLPLSDVWRIVGVIGEKILLASTNGTRAFSRRNCHQFQKTDEDYCVLDQTIVTWYSGVVEDDSFQVDYDIPEFLGSSE